MMQPIFIILAVLVIALGWLAWLVVMGMQELKAHRTYHRKADENKTAVMAFYENVFNKKNPDFAEKCLDENYIQHNPSAVTGRDGFMRFIRALLIEHPDWKTEFKRVFAEDDFVIVHSKATMGPNDRGSAVIDIFRVEYGKIMEHWDVIQPVPEKSHNTNTMF
jgi:predicted SnoaL-like aldol condensation-catalyzing enzyme